MIIHTSAQSENNEIEDDSEESTPGTDVFKAYIGKTVFHSGKKAYATVMDCDEKYIELLFEGNEENPKKFSLELCLQKNWIRLEE